MSAMDGGDGFAARADRAVREGARPTIGADSSPEDIAAAFAAAGISPGDREQIAKWFPDPDAAYRWSDTDGWRPDDSRDPDKPLLPDDYDIERSDRAWFLVRMQSVGGTLERARQFAIRKRLVPYWPRAVRIVSRGNGKRKRDVTLTTSAFGSYAMVHMPWNGQRAPFGLLTDQEARNHGVGGYVEFGQGPEMMPASLVAKVVEMEEAGDYDHTKRKGGRRVRKGEDEWRKGDIARVVEGPFATFNGIVEAFDGAKARIDVWVNIFGRATLCHLDLAQVSKLC